VVNHQLSNTFGLGFLIAGSYLKTMQSKNAAYVYLLLQVFALLKYVGEGAEEMVRSCLISVSKLFMNMKN
jgi:hypothetical protein